MSGIESNPGPDFICYCKKDLGKVNIVTCILCLEQFHYGCVNFKGNDDPSTYVCHSCTGRKEGFDQHSYFKNVFLNLQNLILDFTMNITDRLTIIDSKLDNLNTKVDLTDIKDNINDVRGLVDNITEKTTNFEDCLHNDINNSEWEKPKKYGYINGKKEFDIPLFNKYDTLNSLSNDEKDFTNDCYINNHKSPKVNKPPKIPPLKTNKNNVKRVKHTKVKILGDSILRNIGSNIEARSNLKVSSTILSGGGIFNIYNLGFSLSETDKICVFSIGGNDFKCFSVNAILNELYNVLNFYQTYYPDKTFVFASLIPRSDINSKLIQMFNYEVKKFCRMNGILFCDTFKSFSVFDYCNDGIHLNHKGINKLGSLYSNFLSKVFLLKEMG